MRESVDRKSEETVGFAKKTKKNLVDQFIILSLFYKDWLTSYKQKITLAIYVEKYWGNRSRDACG